MALPIVALAVLVGCDFTLLRDRTPPPATELEGRPPLYDDRELTLIWNDIADLVSTEAGHAAACQTLPVGAKPCGGPWSYLVYSASSTDEEALQGLVARFNERQAHLNERDGMISTCEHITPPTLAWVDGHCTVQATGSSKR